MMADKPAQKPQPQRPNTDGTFKHIEESGGDRPQSVNDDAS